MFADIRNGQPCKKSNGTEFQVNWDAKYTSDVWDTFRQCIDDKGWPGVICIICKHILEHPKKDGPSAMKKHQQVKACQRAATNILKDKKNTTIAALLACQGVVGQGVCTLNRIYLWYKYTDTNQHCRELKP